MAHLRRTPITAVYDKLELSLTEVKEFLRVDLLDTSQDATLGTLIAASKRRADKHLQNAFGFPEYRYDGYRMKPPRWNPGLTGALTSWAFDPLTDLPIGGDGSGSGDPIFTPIIPEDIKLWCLQKIARWYERRPDGLTSNSVQALVTETWGPEEYSSISHYRRFRGL